MYLEHYKDQLSQWPKTGRHILAHYDDENIIVYQAYRPSIGLYAAKHQHFGGDFSFSRMSWIKPNFLWMMYRSGWGTKDGQEVTLAVTIRRTFFDEILASAVPSTFSNTHFPDHDAWKNAVAESDVRLQWDPDHDPNGISQERRAIQLGLRGSMLQRYGKDEIITIEDISDFVAEQREHVLQKSDELMLPREEVYSPNREDAWTSIGLQHQSKMP